MTDHTAPPQDPRLIDDHANTSGNPHFASVLDARLSRSGELAWTFASLALMRPAMVADVKAGTRAPLGPCLSHAAGACRLGGQPWHGEWHNVGTQAQWAALQPAA